ncbi:Vgb family protein, partial [Bacillus sp. LR--39]
GPDGALWFTEINANQIGRITVSGKISEYQLPTAHARPHAIAAGGDGALWFTEWGAGQIGRITVDGDITEYPIPTADSEPHGIAAGSAHSIWFAEECGRIGKISIQN